MSRTVKYLFTALVMCLLLSDYVPYIVTVCNSDPRVQRVSNEYFDAELSPLYLPSLLYTLVTAYRAFQLTLINKSDKDIEIDWNRTLYISQGQTSGGFMFEGIAYLTRNNPKPPDVVFAHSSMSKQIFPNNLVLFNGVWDHSPMISGENGVYLSVIVDGKEITEKLIVSLLYEEIPIFLPVLEEKKVEEDTLENQNKDFKEQMEDIKMRIERLRK